MAAPGLDSQITAQEAQVPAAKATLAAAAPNGQASTAAAEAVEAEAVLAATQF
jgi:hypothetical protein